MIQPLSEADHICQTIQVQFDRMLCDSLEEHHSFPGFSLLLGCIFQHMNRRPPHSLLPAIVDVLYPISLAGEGRILDRTGVFGANGIYIHGTSKFFMYLMELLESPERSGIHIVDQQWYATTAKECLQLFLCSHRNFSKGATDFACYDKAIRRNKPWEWVARLGVHSRIRSGRRQFKLLQCRSIRARAFFSQDHSFPENSPENKYYRFLSYRWALDLLPFLLEKSAISSELADVLHGCTFTTMAWKFPRRMRLAKEAIGKYLVRVESAVGDS